MAANGGIKGKLNKPSHGGNAVTTITASGNFVTQQGTTEVDVLTVAGGGGSGGDQGAGGGGAGGFRNLTRQHVLANSNIAITVGAGGAAGGTGTPEDGSSGANSVFASAINPITSTGGGGGGLGDSGGGGTGVDGGSGGGGGGRGDDAGGSGTAGQGNDGGKSKPQSSPTNDRGGGGGGAGAAGTDGANDPGAAGNGGAGAPSTITGTATYYAGGGGGGSESTGGTAGGAGGVGGGGPGGNGAAGTAGTANTGGGGGASGSAPTAGGAGGSGVVIVKEKDKATGVWNMKTQYSSKVKGQWPDPNQYEINNSLRFHDSDSAYLSITPSGIGNRRTFTYSGWIKTDVATASSKALLSCGSDSGSNDYIMFQSGDKLRFSFGTESEGDIITTRLFRDPSAWYHIVFAVDTTQATAASRVKLYVNGKEATDVTGTYPDQNYDTAFNNTEVQRIGARAYSATQYYEGYMSDVYLIDGQALHCGHFGEPDPDNPSIWRPKKYEGTFGTNGFKLEFKQTGTSANASGMGADTSGNGNHLTPSNLTSLDVTEDSPTNNFCTLNPLYNWYVDPALTEGNCKVSHSATHAGTKGTMAVSKGKWYWEIKLSGSSMGDHHHGVQEINVDENAQNPQNITGTTVFYNDDGGEIKVDSTATTSNYGTLGANDILGVALNMDGGSYGQITFYDNGSAIASDVNLSSSSDYVMPFGAIGNSIAEYNFGNPSYSISSGNADGNGYGNFEHAVPSGYYALCTKNLAQYG